MKAWVKAVRPHQWTKNAFVLAPLVFAGQLGVPAAVGAAIVAAIAFSLAASATYLINDVLDREADAAHPLKRNRPIASGAITVVHALVAAGILVSLSLVIAFRVDTRVGLILAAYIGLTQLYNLRLKHVVVVDAFVLSLGFVLRLLGGAAAIHVEVTIWLLLCGGLLALFLAFAKRRQELLALGDDAGRVRAVLEDYNISFLDQASSVLLSTTLISYVMYTITSETAQAAGPNEFAFSAIFVLFGMLRYVYLIDRGTVGDPTDAVFSDMSLLWTIIAWILYCAWVLY